MKTAIVAIALYLISTVALAGDRIVGGDKNDDYITIQDRACESGLVVSLVSEPYRAGLKHAVYGMRDGKTKIQGCWTYLPEHPGIIFTLWEDGGMIPVPENEFRPIGQHRPGHRPDHKSHDE